MESVAGWPLNYGVLNAINVAFHFLHFKFNYQISGRFVGCPPPDCCQHSDESSRGSEHNFGLCEQVWKEKSKEEKLDYEMKSFNASKGKSGENGAGKYQC